VSAALVRSTFFIVWRMAFFLVAMTPRLLNRILGAPDTPFGAIVPKRGEVSSVAGAGTGVSAVVDGLCISTIRAAASASATPTRWARSVNDQVGASPSVRSVVCGTTQRT
jgi:hypothetical protein